MTKVVVNAISIKEGGSLVVLRELISGMVKLRPEWNWIIITNSDSRGMIPEHPSLTFKNFPFMDKSAWGVNLWYDTALPRLLDSIKADLLFSLTNYLPRRPLTCKTLLLVQHAGHYSDKFNQLMKDNYGLVSRYAWGLKKQWVTASIKRASLVTVQTDALAKSIIRNTGCANTHVRVIPHGCGQVTRQAAPARPPDADKQWRLGYITKAGIQKNFSVLFKAVKLLKDRGYIFKLVLTLTIADPANRDTLAMARELGIDDMIENHGEALPGEIKELYKSLHIFVFPSLCESFGFPMVEAMAHGIPLLVSDIESNLEIAGDAGVAFKSEDPAGLSQELERLFNEEDWYKQRAGASLERSNEYQWPVVVENTLSLIDAIVVR